MKNFIRNILFISIIFITSNCSNNGPKVELKNSKVYLHNFTYVKGISGSTSVTTNANEFDELIWDQFQNTSGTYDLIYFYEKKDQYGNINKSEVFFGKINLSEIRKYQTFEDFRKDNGFFKIVEK